MSNTIKRDAGPGRLPAMPLLSTLNAADPELANWAKSVNEWVQIMGGERGNPLDRAVTLRELQGAMGSFQKLAEVVNREPAEGEVPVEIAPGVTASVAVERFAKSIIESKLFQDLIKSLNDPTRFDELPEEIREELRKDLSTEAKKLGAAIQELERTVENNERSYAMAVRQITASLHDAQAGLRQTMAAWTDGSRAVAVNILQLTSSLGNFYQDGQPGRASLEQSMTTLASYADGLRAQYTVKLQAGGAMAGIGLAAEEVNGKITSAFIISAAQFAIVSPNYAGGVLSVPRPEDVVFGVDGDGIYLQRNVYLKGNMRIDGSSRVLRDGLRGSLQISASGQAWSDTTARQAIWQALGNTGSALSNNHLVIGDMVTIVANNGTAWTRQWMGGSWEIPGLVLNGNLLVDGTVAARSINSNGLTVRDEKGNIILSSGGMDATWLRNLMASQVSGLGGLATQNYVSIGSTVRLPDGSVMNSGDFVNRLSKIEAWNIGTFIEAGAIGRAYIGQAAIGSAQIDAAAVKSMHVGDAEIGTLKVAGGAITSMHYARGGVAANTIWASWTVATMYLDAVAGGTGFVVDLGGTNTAGANDSTYEQNIEIKIALLVDGVEAASLRIIAKGGWVGNGPIGETRYGSTSVFINPPAGRRLLSLQVTRVDGAGDYSSQVDAWMTAVGGKR